MQTEWIALESIESGERKRPLDMTHVTHLSNSIKEIGLQTPITVMARRDADGWRSILVAGAHRLEALRLLGKDGADCFVLPDDQDAADLWEIDENFARAELSDAQRADHHVRREAILVRRGEVSNGRGGDQSEKSSLRSYAGQASESLGVTKRTVEKDLRRGKNIAPDVLAAVAGTDLDKGVVLDQLAATPRDEQRDKLAEIQRARSVVRPAPDPLNDPEAHEKQLSALMSAWNRAAAVVRQEFLLRIDGPVFDTAAA